jgi:hypothetical protein
MPLFRCVILSNLILLPLCAGCNSEDKETAPVRGIVLVDGKPLNFGRVQFSPIANGDSMKAGKAGFGYIGADGRFTLTTYKPEDGAVVGQHRATIVSRSRPLPENEKKPPRDKTIPPFETLRLMGQRFEVHPGQDNHIEIKLTAEQIRKFGEHE